MKKFEVIIIILIVFILSSCASVKGEVKNEELDSMELFYETDFSSYDGAFNPLGRGEINEIRDGVLHLKAAADGRAAHGRLERIYGNNSITTFKIKFEEKVSAHINFLQMNGDRFMLCFFSKYRLDFNSIIASKVVEHAAKKISLKPGRWYDIAVSIIDYKASVYIDGVKIGTVALDKRLPEKSYMSFECHEEYWVDDLRIAREPVVMKEEPAAMKEEQVVMREEQVAVARGNILYETDFSRDDGAFNPLERGEINEIREGVLHLKAAEDGRVAWAYLKKFYGNNSATKFRIEFAKQVKAHVNLLQMKGDRLLVYFGENHLEFITFLNNKEIQSYSEKVKLTTGRYYDITVSIIDYTASVAIDGVKIGTVALDRRLPTKGYMSFECHEEYWVDALKIVEGPVEIIEEPIEIVEEPVETKEEPVAVVREPRGEGLELTDVEFENIFPVFFKYYDEYPIGKGVLRNYEANPISDIEVKLFIKQYMDNPKICGAPTEMKAGEKKEIKLNALFTNKVLEITEGTKVSTNITIEYKLRGKAHTTEKLDTLRIQNRNAMTWEDDRRAAAFVTAKDPVVLKFSKNISGMIKEKGSKAINANLRMAMALHEALTLYGMSYVVDPTTPYKEFSKMRQEIDFLQFPKQSLDYKAGDCDDLSILNCALLESVGIETALITIPGHIFMAFSVDMKPDEARKRFLRADELIFREDKTWIPVEITEIGGGFLKAWQRGAKQWRENVARGQAGFYPMHEAWGIYEPVGLPGEVIHLTLPDRDSIVSAYLQELIKFIDREIYPQVAKVQAEIKKSKANSKDVNKLGILYARYGLTDRAEREFKKILEKNKSFIPALVNLGNICYLNNDMKNALKYYERAYKVAPKNPRVLLCIARTNHELENYGLVKETYSRLKELNPDLAYQFSYLDLRGEEAVRAAEISKVQEVVIWEE